MVNVQLVHCTRVRQRMGMMNKQVVNGRLFVDKRSVQPMNGSMAMAMIVPTMEQLEMGQSAKAIVFLPVL